MAGVRAEAPQALRCSRSGRPLRSHPARAQRLSCRAERDGGGEERQDLVTRLFGKLMGSGSPADPEAMVGAGGKQLRVRRRLVHSLTRAALPSPECTLSLARQACRRRA